MIHSIGRLLYLLRMSRGLVAYYDWYWLGGCGNRRPRIDTRTTYNANHDHNHQQTPLSLKANKRRRLVSFVLCTYLFFFLFLSFHFILADLFPICFAFVVFVVVRVDDIRNGGRKTGIRADFSPVVMTATRLVELSSANRRNNFIGCATPIPMSAVWATQRHRRLWRSSNNIASSEETVASAC